ncbi:hypothetical protein Tco_1512101 [Tanacetum coccineum]
MATMAENVIAAGSENCPQRLKKACMIAGRLKSCFTSKAKKMVTSAKQARDLHVVKFDQLFAFLKHNEKDAKEVREMRQRFPDPLALLAKTYNPPPSYNTQDILPQITNSELRPIQELKLQFKMAKLRFRLFKEDSLKVKRAMLERVKLQEQI